MAALAALALLAACGRVVPPQTVPLPPPSATPSPPPSGPAALLPLRAGLPIGSLGLGQQDAAGALAGFRESCPQLLARRDSSGLTRPDDWRPACDAARTWPFATAADFFVRQFETVEVAGGDAFATGYYEPEIAGVRLRQPGFEVPVYGLPAELVRAWPAETPESERRGRPPLGRVDEAGRLVPYYERAEIDAGALAGRGLEIAWVADPIDLFFVEIQGSARLRAPDGSALRIGYAGQNGREYVAIGRVLRERGLLAPGQATMQGIVTWLRAHPEQAKAIMRENKSWVFFRELTGANAGEGPLGLLGVPVRAGSSVAADPAFVPLGAPVWLSLDRPEANGLWVAQDVGGAIKGPNRFDTFWGTGAAAAVTAGGMSAKGRALLLLPKGTLARLGR